MSTSMRARIVRRTLAVVLLGALVAVGTVAFGQLRQGTPPLWEVVRTDEQPPRSKEVISAHVVRVDLARLRSSDNASFSLLMPDNQRLQIVRSRQKEMQSAIVWVGTIDGDPLSSVTLSAGTTVVVGTISSARGKLYRLRFWKDDLHVVELLDPTKFPDERAPRSVVGELRARSAIADTGTVACADSGQEIDVMVVYTDDARGEAGNTEAMELIVYEAVEQANESYIRSDIQQRLRLVHVREEAYQETGNIDKDLDALQKVDNVLDNVHALRDQYSADAVVLITKTSSERGLSNVMEIVDHSFESKAFAVVWLDTATTLYTFAHELGHIMSARHDRIDDDKENLPYAYNHAHAQPNPTRSGPWRTIMATKLPCDRAPIPVYCTRLLQWSNPDVDWQGDATGVADFEDNARTLNNTARTVANFRCSARNRPDVWMKDTWSDTGAEPDPSQNNEKMWKSPYIWVRNAADPQRVHQHEHQMPLQGSVQFIYVKVHNGGDATSGTLEVYGAPASTQLSWPAYWALLASTPQSLPAHATSIVELQWTPDLAGHYCLLARLVSVADPMTAAEGPDIGVNVRANNNLIWRNVNVVDLVSGPTGAASFIVRNAEEQTMEIRLSVQPDVRHSPSFIAVGKVTLQLPAELLKQSPRGRVVGSGFTRSGNEFVLNNADGAVLEGFRLPGRFAAPVMIRFERSPDGRARDAYELDVVQSVVKRDRTDVVGGVSYDIRTNRLAR